MEAATLPAPHALPTAAAGEWDWVYDDPDLAPFRGTTRRPRPETPLTAFA